MEKLKSVLATVPLTLGVLVLFIALKLKQLSDFLAHSSLKLHVQLNTEVGQKIKRVTEEVKAAAAEKRTADDSAKLVKIFNGDNLGKKSTTDN